uniref:Uncharacterized protein n=1 Tax=Timema tahoe TaxID=61484 RepID=A0A7R9IH49_9NEOP|nr:unnamed protein product [Timema tahoe]
MEEFNTVRFIDEPFMVVKELKLPIDIKLNQEPDVKDSATVLILAFKEELMKRASSLSVLSGHNTEQGFMSYVLCPQHVRSNVASLRGRTASTEQLLLQNATQDSLGVEAVTPTTQPSRSAVSSTGAGAEFPSSKISNDELQSVNLGVTSFILFSRLAKWAKVRHPLKLPRLRFRHTCRTVGESMVIVSGNIHVIVPTPEALCICVRQSAHKTSRRSQAQISLVLTTCGCRVTSLTIPTMRGLLYLYSCLSVDVARATTGSSIYRQFTGTPEPYQPRPVIM